MVVMMKKHYHTFQHESRTAEVWKTLSGHWATRHYKNNGAGSVWEKDIIHKGKSEQWAEDAAENWVLGVME